MELLVRRLPPIHPLYRKILMEIQTTRAGDYGEKIVFKELEKLRLPFKCYIFHRVMLRTGKIFEVDALLLTPFGVVIFEVKNITGKLEFKDNPSQLIQTKDSGEINNYPCPVTQLSEYTYLLSKFFSDNNFTIPILGAIVFATRKSYVETSSSKATILYTNEVHSFLRNLQNHSPALTDSQMDLLKNLILKRDSPFTYFPLTKHFYIDSSDVLRGVGCPNCGQIGMQKVQKKWYCSNCHLRDSKAYIHSVRTYFLLCNTYITNKDCREFLQLNSRDEAKRILSNSNLVKIGKLKSTRYTMKAPNRP